MLYSSLLHTFVQTRYSYKLSIVTFRLHNFSLHLLQLPPFSDLHTCIPFSYYLDCILKLSPQFVSLWLLTEKSPHVHMVPLQEHNIDIATRFYGSVTLPLPLAYPLGSLLALVKLPFPQFTDIVCYDASSCDVIRTIDPSYFLIV